jgi:hypothetical protein
MGSDRGARARPACLGDRLGEAFSDEPPALRAASERAARPRRLPAIDDPGTSGR